MILRTATGRRCAAVRSTVADGPRPTQRISVTDILWFVIGTGCLAVLEAHGWRGSPRRATAPPAPGFDDPGELAGLRIDGLRAVPGEEAELLGHGAPQW